MSTPTDLPNVGPDDTTTATPSPPDAEAPELPLDLPTSGPATDPLPGKAPRRPRRSAPKDGAAAKPRGRSATRRAPAVDIAGRIAQLYTMTGIGLSMIPSSSAAGVMGSDGATLTQVIGQQVASSAEACGKAWEKLAAENPQVRAALERVLTVSVFGELIAAHMPILVVAGAASGYLPDAVAASLAGQAETA